MLLWQASRRLRFTWLLTALAILLAACAPPDREYRDGDELDRMVALYADRVESSPGQCWTRDDLLSEWERILDRYPAVGWPRFTVYDSDPLHSGVTICRFNPDHSACREIVVGIASLSPDLMRPVLWHEAGHVLMYRRPDAVDHYLAMRPLHGVYWENRWYEVMADDFAYCNGVKRLNRLAEGTIGAPPAAVCSLFREIGQADKAEEYMVAADAAGSSRTGCF